MLVIRSKISMEGFPSQRAWDRAKREAHAEQGMYWHKVILPRHFEYSAKNKYGHKPRTPAYRARKNRLARKFPGWIKKKGTVDNVFTGNLEATMRSAASYRVFPSRVTVVMSGPRYITMRPYKSNQPDKAKEITAVTPWEEHFLGQTLDRSLTKSMKANREKKTIVI